MDNIVVTQQYIDDVIKCKNNMIYVEFLPEELQKIDNFVTQVIQTKQQERHHKIDNKNEYKRFFTGMMGEYAVEKIFEQKFVDWTIGNSTNYNVADLKALGINVGIKTVEIGKYPIIHKKAERPEIICIRRRYNLIIICGLATIDVLNTYQDNSLVLSPYLRRRGVKTGFNGFEHLVGFSTLEDLKKYLV